MTTTSTFDTALASLGIRRTTQSPVVQSASTADQLTTADFIKLLTAQLKNQDPTEPTDAAQQMSQLAQYSTVSGINDVNTTLKAIQDKLSTTSPADALSYVGKSVLVPGGTAYPRTSGGLQGAVELGAAADDVKVTISAANGEPLTTLSLGPQAKGTATFDWDGTTRSGASAGNGPFQITAIAQSGGALVSTQTLVWAPVNSVTVPQSGTPQLSLPGLGKVDASTVRQVG